METAYGLGANGWGRYEREERDLPIELILTLRKKDGISADWLLTGEGRKHLPGAAATDETATYDATRFVEVPLYKGVAARAGSGALIDPQAETVVEMRAFSAAWLRREIGSNPADLRMIHVEGDSMDDGRGGGLQAGSVIMVDMKDNAVLKDGIYVLLLGEALMVKQLQRLPGDRLEVSSLNRSYKPFEVDLKQRGHELHILGRVRLAWTMRRF